MRGWADWAERADWTDWKDWSDWVEREDWVDWTVRFGGLSEVSGLGGPGGESSEEMADKVLWGVLSQCGASFLKPMRTWNSGINAFENGSCSHCNELVSESVQSGARECDHRALGVRIGLAVSLQ